MSLFSFKLLADENIDKSVTEYLISQGFDVYCVKGGHLEGRSDLEVLSFGMQEQRVILTHDTDFTTIAYTDKVAFVGIVFLQPGHIIPTFTLQTIKAVLSQHMELVAPFIIVAENKKTSIKIRLRNNIIIS